MSIALRGDDHGDDDRDDGHHHDHHHDRGDDDCKPAPAGKNRPETA